MDPLTSALASAVQSALTLRRTITDWLRGNLPYDPEAEDAA